MELELPKPGLYRDVDYDTYASWPAVRSSVLKLFDRTPAHARYAITHARDSQPLLIGNATHRAILEPDKFDETYAIAPKVDRRTNAGKAMWTAFLEENAGRIALLAEEYELLRGWVDAVTQHPVAGELVKDAEHREASLVWKDAESGIDCKVRLDILRSWRGASTIVELKTAKDASPEGFARDVWNYGYHLQAAHQLAGCDALSPVARQHRFVVVEKAPPFCVAVYTLDEKYLALGFAARAQAMRAYANAVESGNWPGYKLEDTLYAPAWAKVGEGDEETLGDFL